MAISAEEFVAHHPRAVLVTHRRDGGLQSSPIRVLVDGSGEIVACTRSATAKAKNLLRDSRFGLCVLSDEWTGPWVTLEGTAQLVVLPEALGALRSFYLQRDGAIDDSEDFDAKMHAEGRLIVRFHIDRVAGTA